MQEFRKRDAYGRVKPPLPAGPTVTKLAALRDAGWTWPQIAQASGVHKATLNVIWRRRDDAGAVVQQATETAVLAVTVRPEKSMKGYVDSTGTRRRLQALVAMGWSFTEIARRLDLPMTHVSKLARNTTCTVRTRERIRALYATLSWAAPPDGFGKDRAIRNAHAHGWVGPLAWVDSDIDDPDAEPDVSEAADDAGWRVNELEHLWRLGESPTQAAFALGGDRRNLSRLARRHGRDDLARWIDLPPRRKEAA